MGGRSELGFKKHSGQASVFLNVVLCFTGKVGIFTLTACLSCGVWILSCYGLEPIFSVIHPYLSNLSRKKPMFQILTHLVEIFNELLKIRPLTFVEVGAWYTCLLVVTIFLLRDSHSTSSPKKLPTRAWWIRQAKRKQISTWRCLRSRSANLQNGA